MFVTKKKYTALLEKYEKLKKHKKVLERRNKKYREKYIKKYMKKGKTND